MPSHSNKRFVLILLADLLAALIIFFALFPGFLPVKLGRLIQERPNVIFIVLDAARADHFSGYGYPENTTPYMDAIARRGATFLNNFSPGTHTLVSVPRYFSSRYFSKSIWGLSEWDWGIRSENIESILLNYDDQQIFLPDLISRDGYKTAIFHDHACFTEHSLILSLFQEAYSLRDSFHYPAPVDKEIVAKTISWIEKNRDGKLFIYCHIMSPHEPYPPKKEDFDFIGDRNSSMLQYVRKKGFTRKSWFADDWTENELEYLRILYDSNLKHTDNYVGALYNKLVELGLEDKTLIILTSDHGENLGEHNVLGHGFRTYDSVTHVPLVMVYPPLIPAGVRINGLTESIDIMPTVLDICGIELPRGKEMDGVSLLQFIAEPDNGKPAIFTHESIRTEDYRYITPNRLYDLKKDPGEITNIAPENEQLTDKLRSLFNETMQPHRERYQNARRVKPPDYPFYILIHQFQVKPLDAFERCTNRNQNFLQVINDISPQKSWLINNRSSGSGIICIPANGTPPLLTISGSLPDGIYSVSILVESSGKTPISQITSNLKFSFEPTGNLSQPLNTKPIPGKPETCQYFNLGPVEIREKHFYLRISFNPPDNNPLAIRHIRFIPDQITAEIPARVITEEELLKKRESIKVLGYL